MEPSSACYQGQLRAVPGNSRSLWHDCHYDSPMILCTRQKGALMPVPIATRIRRSLSEPGNPKSMSARARNRRWAELLTRFPELPHMRVLDLGGLPGFWRAATERPASVTTVNIESADADETWITHCVDDACAPGTGLRRERFDLVVSNSLLEHVGGYERRRRLADVVHAAAGAHWVQTPYRYFPIEPHWLAPGWQFLPVPARAAVLRRWPLSHGRPGTRQEALDAVLSTELVSVSELSLLFPSSEIWRERVVGLTKSLVAVRS